MISDEIKKCFGGTIVESGEIAYSAEQIELISSMILDKNWIILGGDMYSNKGKFTYTTWFYEPLMSTTLRNNVINSVIKCKDFIKKMEKTAPGSLYVLVITDTYIAGTL